MFSSNTLTSPRKSLRSPRRSRPSLSSSSSSTAPQTRRGTRSEPPNPAPRGQTHLSYGTVVAIGTHCWKTTGHALADTPGSRDSYSLLPPGPTTWGRGRRPEHAWEHVSELHPTEQRGRGPPAGPGLRGSRVERAWHSSVPRDCAACRGHVLQQLLPTVYKGYLFPQAPAEFAWFCVPVLFF